jgi:hypothetical protein
MRLEHHYSDDELLLELRRRGRIARVEAADVVPDRFMDHVPLDHQFQRVFAIAANAMVRHIGTHERIPGASVEIVDDLYRSPGFPPGRRMRMALNVIVEKK